MDVTCSVYGEEEDDFYVLYGCSFTIEYWENFGAQPGYMLCNSLFEFVAYLGQLLDDMKNRAVYSVIFFYSFAIFEYSDLRIICHLI